MTPSPWYAFIVPVIVSLIGLGVVVDLVKILLDRNESWPQRFRGAARFFGAWILVNAALSVPLAWVTWRVAEHFSRAAVSTQPPTIAQPQPTSIRGCAMYDIVPEYPECARQAIALYGTCVPPVEALRGGSGDLRVDLLGYCAALRLQQLRDR
jgi:hypothetical protein